MRLQLHEWGDPRAQPLVCLHGITGHGRHFRRLAEERLAHRFRVLAPDLRGHGASGQEPPWDIETHLGDVRETLEEAGVEHAVWIGHSFGGRLVMELAACDREPIERAVLLDPSIQILPHVGLDMAEESRGDRSYASLDEAIDARFVESRLTRAPRELLEEELPEHLARSSDGRLRYRYCASAVIVAYNELTREPPPFERLRLPTLLLIGNDSWLVLDDQLERYRAALGDLLEVATVPGGHTVLWEAFAKTADAVEAFLARS